MSLTVRDARSRIALLLVVALLCAQVEAHMSIWSTSMYGVADDKGDFIYAAGDPVSPIGPDVQKQNDWWFRGPAYRALSPSKRKNGTVTELPAGGEIELEIACNVAWTSFRPETATKNGSPLDACPDNSGAYHAGDPERPAVDPDLVSGCAIGLADVDDIEDVTMDNLAIISVQSQCVKQKVTSFEIPKRLPACTAKKCICAWFWLASNGTANFYMTGFDCTVTDSPSNALPIAPPVDPVFCAAGDSTCEPARGAKRPLYAYNRPTNVEWYGNDNRPGYHSAWGFEDGAQEDIYLGAVKASSALLPVNVSATSTGSTSIPTAIALPTRLGQSLPTFSVSADASNSSSASRTRLSVSATSATVNATTSMNSNISTRPTSLTHSTTVMSTSVATSTSSRNRTSSLLPTSTIRVTSIIATTSREDTSRTSTRLHATSTSVCRSTSFAEATTSATLSATRRITSTRLTTIRRTTSTYVYQSIGGTGSSKSTQTAKTRITGSAGSRSSVGWGLLSVAAAVLTLM